MHYKNPEDFIGYLGADKFKGIKTGKDGKEYYLFKMTDFIHTFVYGAYDFSTNQDRLAGICTTYKTNGEPRDPRNFLSLPACEPKTSMWEPFAESFQKNNGVASILMPFVLNELVERGGIAVVSFTTEGKIYMKDKLIQEGFCESAILFPEKIPEKLRSLTNWMHKDYGPNIKW